MRRGHLLLLLLSRCMGSTIRLCRRSRIRMFWSRGQHVRDWPFLRIRGRSRSRGTCSRGRLWPRLRLFLDVLKIGRRLDRGIGSLVMCSRLILFHSFHEHPFEGFAADLVDIHFIFFARGQVHMFRKDLCRRRSSSISTSCSGIRSIRGRGRSRRWF